MENNWAVVAEGIQTVLRRAGYPSPYEALKALTRTNAHITRESIAEFIESLDVAECEAGVAGNHSAKLYGSIRIAVQLERKSIHHNKESSFS